MKNRHIKLDFEKAEEIRKKYFEKKKKVKEISEEYNVSCFIIYRIINNETWKRA